MFRQISPNMLKTYEVCARKFYYRYVKNISMPSNDDIFVLGKNIHALASYYLNGENIDAMEQSLSPKEIGFWNYLKNLEYLQYKVINTEYNLSFRFNDVYLGGRLDALVKNGEDIFILDYKTGSIPKNAKFDYQTIVYLLAVSKLYNTNNVTFIYIDLKNKLEEKIKLTEELKIEYAQKLEDIIIKICLEDIPIKKNNCNCEYSSICF